MQSESLMQTWDLVIHGGASSVIIFGALVFYKVWLRLNRDEDLRKDYPPHRHINGSIIYPNEYEPGVVGKLDVGRHH